jgi:WD40 repeat protein
VRWSAENDLLGAPTRLTFDARGERLIAAGLPGLSSLLGTGTGSEPSAFTIHAWDAETGAARLPVAALQDVASAFALDGSGSRLAVSGVLGTRILDVFSGAVLARVPGVTSATQLVFSPDGKHLAGVVNSRHVRVWSSADGTQIWSKPDPGQSAVAPTWSRIAFSPDGRAMIAAGSDRSLRILDARSGTELSSRVGHTGAITSVAVLPDGTKCLTGGAEGVARAWTIGGPQPQPATVQIGRADLAVVAADPAANLIAAATTESGIKMWTLDSLELRASTPSLSFRNITSLNPLLPISVVSLVPRNPLVMMPGLIAGERADGTMLTGYEYTVVNALTGAEMAKLREPRLSGAKTPSGPGPDKPGRAILALVSAAGLQPQGDFAVVATTTTNMDLTTLVGTLAKATAEVSGLPTPTIGDTHVDFWSVRSARLVQTVPIANATVVAVTFSPSGDRTVLTAVDRSGAAGAATTTYQIRETATVRLLHSFPARGSVVTPPVFDRAGRRMAAISSPNEVAIWDARTGGQLATLASQTGGIAALAFSQDGDRLAELTGDGVVKLFDTHSGKLLVTLRESDGPFSKRDVMVAGRVLHPGAPALAFSDDGRRIVATVMTIDLQGVKIEIRTWDGAPRDAREGIR